MWLYVPNLDLSKDAPGSACLGKALAPASTGSELTAVLWVTSSGIATQRQHSWRGWKIRPWIARLLPAISNPLMAERGAAAWIASLPVSPASLGAQPASKKGSTTPAGSGRLSFGSFGIWSPESCSWKTCQASFLEEDSNTSSVILPKWGSMRSGAISRREPWAPDTSASDSSSWPTPNTAPDAPNGGLNRGDGQIRNRDTDQCLGSRATSWPTPTAKDEASTSASGYELSGSHHPGTTLTDAIRAWPSPRAEDSESCGNHPNATDSLTGAISLWATPAAHERAQMPRDVDHGIQLANQVDLWATPNAMADGSTSRDGDRIGEPLLGGQASQWQTSTANPATYTAGNAPGYECLPGQVQNWPTPNARDHTDLASRNGGASLSHATETGEFSHLAPAIQGGAKSSTTARTSRRRLNPAFVCWLMGWPWWWTRPEPINCAAEEMALWRLKLRWHLSCLLNE